MDKIKVKDVMNKSLKEIMEIDDVTERLSALHSYAKVQNDLNESKSNKMSFAKDGVQIVCSIASIAVPAIMYNTWMKRGFEFEKTGTYTSTTFRNMFSKFHL